MEFHEYANLFPMMSDGEFDGLLADMQESGFRPENPIVTYDGKILDGRNRYRAATELGLKPAFRKYEGKEPLAFVISQNLTRRHLNESQRAVIAGRLANIEKHIHKDDSQIWLSQPEAARMFNVGVSTLKTVKAVERDAPELIEKIERGEMTAHEASKKSKEMARNQERANIVKQAEKIKPSDRWNVYLDDIQTWQAERKYDFIITDPPYPKEYLNLYEVLAKRASEWLKPGGLLVAMCGQSYLDEIYRLMSKHIDYYWTAAYLTPGQPTPLRHRQVNSTWKPLLIFSHGDYKGRIFGDVFKSDGNDKSMHKWGQSVSGMYDVVSKICLPGQYILDPFCGAGTTGVAAMMHNCLFDGVELLPENVKISKKRIHDAEKE